MASAISSIKYAPQPTAITAAGGPVSVTSTVSAGVLVRSDRSHSHYTSWYQKLNSIVQIFTDSNERLVTEELRKKPAHLENFSFLPYRVFQTVLQTMNLFDALSHRIQLTCTSVEIANRMLPIQAAIKAIKDHLSVQRLFLQRKEGQLRMSIVSKLGALEHCEANPTPYIVLYKTELNRLVKGTGGITSMLGRVMETLEDLSPLVQRKKTFEKTVRRAYLDAEFVGEPYFAIARFRLNPSYFTFPNLLTSSAPLTLPFQTETDCECVTLYYDFYTEYVEFLSFYALYLRKFTKIGNALLAHLDKVPTSMSSTMTIPASFATFKHPLFAEKLLRIFFVGTGLPRTLIEIIISYDEALSSKYY